MPTARPTWRSPSEQIFRTRWTVRVTLHPAARTSTSRSACTIHRRRASYYFWNCTAFPNNRGTRFVFPMTLGTDHFGREFFHCRGQGARSVVAEELREVRLGLCGQMRVRFFGPTTWVRIGGSCRQPTITSCPARKPGPGRVGLRQGREKNLTDTDGRYIEVQSGPLPRSRITACSVRTTR